MLGLTSDSKAAAYMDWFLPAQAGENPLGAVTALLQGLTMVKDERDAKLQVLMMTSAMELSPSRLVKTIGAKVRQEPDGVIGTLLTKVHTKISNPLDFAVFLHSPRMKEMLAQVDPKMADESFSEGSEDTRPLIIV